MKKNDLTTLAERMETLAEAMLTASKQLGRTIAPNPVNASAFDLVQDLRRATDEVNTLAASYMALLKEHSDVWDS